MPSGQDNYHFVVQVLLAAASPAAPAAARAPSSQRVPRCGRGVSVRTSANMKAKVSRPAGRPQCAAAANSPAQAQWMPPSSTSSRKCAHLPVFGDEDSWITKYKH